jgi:hypothetical protein
MPAFFFQWDIVLVLAAILVCGLIAAGAWWTERPAGIVVGTVAVLGAVALSMALVALWVLW